MKRAAKYALGLVVVLGVVGGVVGLGVALPGIIRRNRFAKHHQSLPPAAKTAPPRESPSRLAEWAVGSGFVRSPALDWGGGYGKDAEWFSKRGIQSYMYDPYLQPGLPPRRDFNYGQLSYVLDIIQSDRERIDTLKKMATYLAQGAHVAVSAINQKRLEQIFSGSSEHKWLAPDRVLAGMGVVFEAMNQKKLAELFEAAGIEPTGYQEGEWDVFMYGRKR